jgi:hypothetical protein
MECTSTVRAALPEHAAVGIGSRQDQVALVTPVISIRVLENVGVGVVPYKKKLVIVPKSALVVLVIHPALVISEVCVVVADGDGDDDGADRDC